jgi:hypothetical protein
LKERKQPLLFKNFRNIREYFPVELCQEAALPENFTADAGKMKTLQSYKISNPNERFAKINDVPARFAGMPVLNQFDIELSKHYH